MEMHTWLQSTEWARSKRGEKALRGVPATVQPEDRGQREGGQWQGPDPAGLGCGWFMSDRKNPKDTPPDDGYGVLQRGSWLEGQRERPFKLILVQVRAERADGNALDSVRYLRSEFRNGSGPAGDGAGTGRYAREASLTWVGLLRAEWTEP